MKKWMCLVCVSVLGGAMTVQLAKAQANDQDKQFLQKASQGDANEIKLSQLAERKASNPNIRAFAKTMVTEHTQLEKNMKPYADQWGLTPATDLDADHQKEYEKLSKLSGKAFDKEYIDAMDKDHHGAEDLFTNEINSTSDPDFKKAVMDGKSAVVAHTNMADDLKNKVS
jgi:putative membrane protein